LEVGGAELMAATVMSGGTPAENSDPTEDQRDEVEGGVGAKISFGVVRSKHPTKSNSHVRTVVKANTPTVTVIKGNEHSPVGC
jgi:hypothetical protein